MQTTVSGGVRPPWYSSTAWHTMSVGGWWKFLWAHGFRITPSRWPVAVGATLYTLNNSVLGALQSATYGLRLRGTRIEHDPVFILGHWRSGTTHLHELLAQDERFAFPTLTNALHHSISC